MNAKRKRALMTHYNIRFFNIVIKMKFTPKTQPFYIMYVTHTTLI